MAKTRTSFQPGHPGGPGRPKKEREVRFLEITLSAVTFDDWSEIVQRAVRDAKKGDSTARKWLGDYLIGVPVQRIAPTTPDGENPYMTMDADELIKLAKQIVDANPDNPAS